MEGRRKTRVFNVEMPPEKHGTQVGYRRYECGCKHCRKAHVDGVTRARMKARARAVEDPSIVIHGTLKGYNYYGCKCALCRSAGTEARRKYGHASSRAR